MPTLSHACVRVLDLARSVAFYRETLGLTPQRELTMEDRGWHLVFLGDNETPFQLELCKEIVRCDALDRVHIGLDYFDASINRIGAYVIGSRATQKCLMQALLEPLAQLRRYEAAGQGFERLALLEEAKSLPWNAVWDMFCLRNDVPVGEEFIAGIQQYEREVTSKR